MGRLILLFILLLQTLSALEQKNILFVSSYNPGIPWSQALVKGINDAVRAQKRYNITIYDHYFDTLRLGKSQNLKIDYDFFKNRYKKIKFDLIISDEVYAMKSSSGKRRLLFILRTNMRSCGQKTITMFS